MTESLDCFVCSELDSIACPDANSDYASWKAEAHQYVSHNPTASNGISCSIIIGGKTLDKLINNTKNFKKQNPHYLASGRTYHQSALSTIQCVSPRYRLAMAQNIAQKFRDPDSKVLVSRLCVQSLMI